ncbi:hypothetical protein Baya_1035 [Bagarius yarrelli]|uniref:Uncharacterized protein n=1 Tax=Bagarius yarrelli TaxID=175774 RepID=A0A556TJY4_BAGYA|nr:hypothetical protein Baya_1035 [Bagarius yarrelli]
MDYYDAVQLVELDQGKRTMEEHACKFLNLAYLTKFFGTFFFIGLNAKAKLFGSVFTLGPAEETQISRTPYQPPTSAPDLTPTLTPDSVQDLTPPLT